MLIRIKACVRNYFFDSRLIGVPAVGSTFHQFPAVPFLSADCLLPGVLLNIGSPGNQVVHTGEDVFDVLVGQQRRQFEIVPGQRQVGFCRARHSFFALQNPHHSPHRKFPSPAKARSAVGFRTSSAQR